MFFFFLKNYQSYIKNLISLIFPGCYCVPNMAIADHFTRDGHRVQVNTAELFTEWKHCRSIMAPLGQHFVRPSCVQVYGQPSKIDCDLPSLSPLTTIRIQHKHITGLTYRFSIHLKFHSRYTGTCEHSMLWVGFFFIIIIGDLHFA